MAPEKMNNEIKDLYEPEEYTNNIEEAIFIFANGSMLSGEFCDGIRGLDHNSLKSCLDNASWDDIHKYTKVVRLVPETNIALIKIGQELTQAQKELLQGTNYAIEEY